MSRLEIPEPRTPEDLLDWKGLPERYRRSLTRHLWERGRLRYKMWPGPQRDAYDRAHSRSMRFTDFGPWVINWHRRLGKSFWADTMAVERCIRSPGQQARLLCYTRAQVEEILEEQWPLILEDCPRELQPRKKKDFHYTFRNPRWRKIGPWRESHLRLYGVKEDRGNRLRGRSCDIMVIDECRDIPDFKKLFSGALLPMFRRRENPMAFMLSTPPHSGAHEWQSFYIPLAREKGLYICVPARDDPNWSEEEDEVFAREMGGRESEEYRREIQCELIPDSSVLILPEFALADKQVGTRLENPFVFSERERPSHYYAYVAIDLGGSKDHYGAVFGYVDFRSQDLVVLDEVFEHDIDTISFGQLVRKKIAENFEADGITRPIDVSLYGDGSRQRFMDLYVKCELAIAVADKRDRDANRAAIRSAFRAGRIHIHERCRNLILQARMGQKNEMGKFLRQKGLGHCDTLSALIYLYKVANFEDNPFPPEPVPHGDRYLVLPENEREVSWDDVFGSRRRRSR